MFRNNKFLLIFLVFILIFSVSCSGNDTDEAPVNNDEVEESKEVEEDKETQETESKDTENKDSESKEKSKEQIKFENLKQIGQIETLINLFEELEYSWSSTGQSTNKFQYEIVGQEKIGDSETTKISIKILKNDNEKIIIWIDDKNNIVKAKVNGKEIPGEVFQNMSESLFKSIFAPFTFAKGFMKGPVFNETHDPVPGYNTKIEDKGNQSISGEEYRLYKVTIEIGPPYSENEKEIILNIGDFDKYQLLMKFKTIDSSKGEEMEFEVTKMKLK